MAKSLLRMSGAMHQEVPPLPILTMRQTMIGISSVRACAGDIDMICPFFNVGNLNSQRYIQLITNLVIPCLQQFRYRQATYHCATSTEPNFAGMPANSPEYGVGCCASNVRQSKRVSAERRISHRGQTLGGVRFR